MSDFEKHLLIYGVWYVVVILTVLLGFMVGSGAIFPNHCEVLP